MLIVLNLFLFHGKTMRGLILRNVEKRDVLVGGGAASESPLSLQLSSWKPVLSGGPLQDSQTVNS